MIKYFQKIIIRNLAFYLYEFKSSLIVSYSKSKIRLFIIYSILIFLNFSTNHNAYSNNQNIFYLTKDNLISEAKNNSAIIENIKANFLEAKFNKNEFLENFQPKLEGELSYFNTNEESFIDYIPVASPISNLSVGVGADLVSGVGLGIYNNIEKKKYGRFGSDSRNSVSFEFTMDFYRNLFGKDSRARISYFDYEEKLAKIQKDIDIEIFLISIYKKYLAIILNEEIIKISRGILKNYQEQESDMKRRYKSGIADLSGVKRSSAQVSAKQVELSNLLNKKELLILDLRNLLPSIAGKIIKLESYNIKDHENYFSNIIANIQEQKSIPMNYTKYDDVIKILHKSYQKQKDFTGNYDNLDLELYSSYNHFGENNSNQKAFTDISSDPGNSYEAGLRLIVPLGKTKNKSKEIRLLGQRSIFLAKKRADLAKIESYHTQSLGNIKILQRSQIYQAQNNKDLQTILKLSRKKYQQARISIRDLIDDQDLYFHGLIREMEVKSIIMNQTLDYMTIFTTTPFALSNG